MLTQEENELIDLVKQAQKRYHKDGNRLDKTNLSNASFLLIKIIERLLENTVKEVHSE